MSSRNIGILNAIQFAADAIMRDGDYARAEYWLSLALEICQNRQIKRTRGRSLNSCHAPGANKGQHVHKTPRGARYLRKIAARVAADMERCDSAQKHERGEKRPLP